ncbi:hypothetical protein CHS0354_000585 [Potamilus streckersoni]|uniref:Fibronectin type-III domain-containing protein n=1 Tax=Potamilus streckersoni TaxID=2493646 RepID=A0AAE0W928_9BIVA|nr:hypothetical protein CHS0354_000585 [Potamilus streckersoni]
MSRIVFDQDRLSLCLPVMLVGNATDQTSVFGLFFVVIQSGIGAITGVNVAMSIDNGVIVIDKGNRKGARLKYLTLFLLSLTFFAGECAAPEPTKYTITFNSNGGSNVENITVTSGNKATKPTDPTRANYLFVGWYKETELKTSFNFDTETITANITLYAKWTAITYTVTLNANGGTPDVAKKISVTYEGTVSVNSAELPTRAKHTLVIWNTKADGRGTPFIFGTTKVTSDITIYAQWIGIPTLTATSISASQINLSWERTTNATKYNLFDGTTQIGGDITDTKYSHTGLEGGSTHSYTLKACNEAGCSEASNAVLAKTNEATVTVTEIPKIGTDKRFHYVAFSIQADANLTDYTMGLVLKTNPETKPTATALRSGASFVRNISTTEINMLIPYVISSTIRTTNTTDSKFKIKGSTADDLLLTDDTTYTLYGMRNGSDNVVKLGDFITNDFPSGGASEVNFNTSAPDNPDYFEKGIKDKIFTQRISDGVVFSPLIISREKIILTSTWNVLSLVNNQTDKIYAVVETTGADTLLFIDKSHDTRYDASELNNFKAIIPTTNYIVIPSGIGVITGVIGVMSIDKGVIVIDNEAMGSPNEAMGSPNVAMGSPNVAMGSPNVAMGSPNVAMGSPNVVMGSPNVVMGSPNVVMGSPNVVMGSPNVVMGSPNVVMGSPNVAMGSPHGAIQIGVEQFF